MPDFVFQWRNESGNLCRMNCSFVEEDRAWYEAFKKCGWENRTSLGLVGTSKSLQICDGIIKNWWQAMSDRKLYNFNTLYLSWNLSDRLRSGFVKLTNV